MSKHLLLLLLLLLLICLTTSEFSSRIIQNPDSRMTVTGVFEWWVNDLSLETNPDMCL